jgi:RHH-type proline utilization regulon transcriptional repressor/proline dehydrogenase/delta 1-pyrroline-5-carboxylate dehydrogenase
MTHFPTLDRPDSIAKAINSGYLADEQPLVRELADHARLPDAARRNVDARALALVQAVRSARGSGGALDAFLREYSLASREGIILMCLAEALLRIPDGETADRLIADKIPSGAWDEHLGDSESLLVNASTWGLMLTGRVVALDGKDVGEARSWYGKLVAKLGEPVARAALKQAMRILGHQFVMGRNIGDALERAAGKEERDYRYSFDMLGEAALTRADAERYREKYSAAIAAVGRAVNTRESINARHGISIKLSALHPRYEFTQAQRVLRELYPVVEQLVRESRDAGIGVTLDAEEADRLELSLLLVDKLLSSEVTRGYAGFGLAVQAYQKRAYPTIEWLARRLREADRRITLRLVKGAYWDSEIKRAQERGLAGYPVFTRKPNTDVSYLACAPPAGRRRRTHLSAIRDPQCAHHRAGGGDLRRRRQPFRIPAPARHGRRAVRQRGTRSLGPVRVPRVCAGGRPRGPAAVPRTPAAGERCQYLVRQSHRRCQPAGRRSGGGPDRRGRCARTRGAPAHRAAGQPVRAERANSTGFNFADGQAVDALLRDCERASQQPWSAAPVVSGKTRAGSTGAGAQSGPYRRADRRGHERRRGRGGGGHRRGGARAGLTGTTPVANIAPASWSAPRSSTRSTPPRWWRAACARPARRCPTPSAKCARRWISCVTTRRVPAGIFRTKPRCRVPPASATSCACVARASSAASAHGISRWLSTRARWPRRWPRATRWSRSRRSRHR